MARTELTRRRTRDGALAPVITAEPVRRWTAARREAFLRELALTANVTRSARSVGLSERGAYHARKRMPEFRAAWAETLSAAYARLELMLLERALVGEEAVRVDGEPEIDLMAQYPNSLALHLLKQHRPTVRADLDGDEEPIEAVRARVEAKLDALNRRLARREASEDAKR